MVTTYNTGDGVRLEATFKDISGAINDPTEVLFFARDPKDAVTALAVTKSDVGVYYADLVLSIPGTWHYRWTGTGNVVAAIEGQIMAKPSAFVT